jgi:glucose/mannose transport system permease protein
MILTALVVFIGGNDLDGVYLVHQVPAVASARTLSVLISTNASGRPKWMISIENLMHLRRVLAGLLAGHRFRSGRAARSEDPVRKHVPDHHALSLRPVLHRHRPRLAVDPQPGFRHSARVARLGWESFTFDPLYNPDIVIYGILIAGLWQGTGLIMCLMLAGLRGIDEDIWKAARVDGIPMWKTYIFIVIPMMRPVFITTLVIIASGIVKLYDLVVAQTGGGPGIASEVPAKYVYDAMFQSQNLGQGFAASTMMLLTVLIVLIPWAYHGIRRQEAWLT